MTQIITIGEGKDYSGAQGLKNCINDFTSLAGEGHVQIQLFKESYDYHLNFDINKTGTDANNFFEIICAPGAEHRGNFSNAVTLLPQTLSGSTIKGIYVDGGYHKFRNLLIKQTIAGSCVNIYFRTGGDYELENMLLYADTDLQNNSSSYCVLCTNGRTFVSKKTIVYAKGLGTYGFYMGGSSTVGKLYKNKIFIPNSSLYPNAGGVAIENNSSSSEYYNTGCFYELDGNGAWYPISNKTNAIGSNNYNNYVNNTYDFGTAFLRTTLTSMAMIDPVNLKFQEKFTSNLIGSGFDDKSIVGDPINGGIWGGDHRSPFSNIILHDVHDPHPDPIHEVVSDYSTRNIFALPFNGSKLPVSDNKSLISSDAVGDSFEASVFGFSYKGISGGRNDYNIPLGGKKQLTFQFAFHKNNNTGTSQKFFVNPEGSPPLDFYFNGSTNTLHFNLSNNAWSASVVLSGSNDLSKWQNCYLVLDLTKSTDAGRMQLYSHCCGYTQKHTLTFAGTAPSQLSSFTTLTIAAGNMLYANHMIWDYSFSESEIYDLIYDVYKPYRDMFNIEMLLQAGYIKGEDGIWRHKSQLFGPSTTMAGTSTMVV